MSQILRYGELDFLKRYEPSRAERPEVALNPVPFAVSEGALRVLLVKRRDHPFKGAWSLPGGRIDLERDFDLDAAARRIIARGCGLEPGWVEQLRAFGDAARDPRHWTLALAFLALCPCVSTAPKPLPEEGPAPEMRWATVGAGGGTEEDLAFDHARILQDCAAHLRTLALHTAAPLYLMPERFTLSALQGVFEILIGGALEAKSFRRRMLGSGLLEETGELLREGRRPARLYRALPMERPHVFLRAIESPGK